MRKSLIYLSIVVAAFVGGRFSVDKSCPDTYRQEAEKWKRKTINLRYAADSLRKRSDALTDSLRKAASRKDSATKDVEATNNAIDLVRPDIASDSAIRKLSGVRLR